MDAEAVYRQLVAELERVHRVRVEEHPDVAIALRRAAEGAQARLRDESRIEVTLPFLMADGDDHVHLRVMIQRP